MRLAWPRIVVGTQLRLTQYVFLRSKGHISFRPVVAFSAVKPRCCAITLRRKECALLAKILAVLCGYTSTQRTQRCYSVGCSPKTRCGTKTSFESVNLCSKLNKRIYPVVLLGRGGTSIRIVHTQIGSLPRIVREYFLAW